MTSTYVINCVKMKTSVSFPLQSHTLRVLLLFFVLRCCIFIEITKDVEEKSDYVVLQDISIEKDVTYACKNPRLIVSLTNFQNQGKFYVSRDAGFFKSPAPEFSDYHGQVAIVCPTKFSNGGAFLYNGLISRVLPLIKIQSRRKFLHTGFLK